MAQIIPGVINQQLATEIEWHLRYSLEFSSSGKVITTNPIFRLLIDAAIGSFADSLGVDDSTISKDLQIVDRGEKAAAGQDRDLHHDELDVATCALSSRRSLTQAQSVWTTGERISTTVFVQKRCLFTPKLFCSTDKHGLIINTKKS